MLLQLPPLAGWFIVNTYHAWRSEPIDGQKTEYKDVLGFCKAIKLDEVRQQRHMLTPGRYVGAEEKEDNEEMFKERMEQLATVLKEQIREGKKLEAEIEKNLEIIGYDF